MEKNCFLSPKEVLKQMTDPGGGQPVWLDQTSVTLAPILTSNGFVAFRDWGAILRSAEESGS